MFKKAERAKTPLKIELFGPPGSGKTWSALMLATEMGYKKIAVLDSEKSASLYSHRFNFDVAELNMDLKGREYLKQFTNLYEQAIKEYDIVIIDSFTHVWNAVKDYVNELGGRYADWGKGSPLWEKIIAGILSSSVPVIVCSRADYDDVLVEIEKNGKKSYEVQRHGIKADVRGKTDYEFTVVLSIDLNHKIKAVKDRTELFGYTMGTDGTSIPMDKSVAIKLRDWINNGTVITQEYKPIDLNEEPIKKSSITEKIVSKSQPWMKEALKIELAIAACKTNEQILSLYDPMNDFFEENKLTEIERSRLIKLFQQKNLELEEKH